MKCLFGFRKIFQPDIKCKKYKNQRDDCCKIWFWSLKPFIQFVAYKNSHRNGCCNLKPQTWIFQIVVYFVFAFIKILFHPVKRKANANHIGFLYAFVLNWVTQHFWVAGRGFESFDYWALFPLSICRWTLHLLPLPIFWFWYHPLREPFYSG